MRHLLSDHVVCNQQHVPELPVPGHHEDALVERVECSHCDFLSVHAPPIRLAISKTARLRASGCSGSFVLYNQRQLIGVDVVKVAVDVDMLWRTFRFSHQASVVLQ